jgi:nicotinate-nucleotide adenylyltransferase
MTAIATSSNAYFDCDDVEMHRSGPSYAVDTLVTLKDRWPTADLFYITGIDATAELITWRMHAEVMRLATFIASARPGFDAEMLIAGLPAEYRERILILNSLALNISSTEIRNRLTAKLPVRYMLPDAVLEYIEEHRLYGG